MNNIFKVSGIVIALFLMLLADVPLLIEDLVPDANAIYGVRRRVVRRGVIIGSAGASSASTTAAAQQQAATAQQQAATAPEQAAAPAPSTPQADSNGHQVPLGTIVQNLPEGCTSKSQGGVAYSYCSGTYYRAAFQGNNLVYVVTTPQ